MSQLRLEDYTEAYRSARSAKVDHLALLARIRRTIEVRRTRRLSSRLSAWIYGIGTSTVFAVSLGYAGTYTRSVAGWLQDLAGAPEPFSNVARLAANGTPNQAQPQLTEPSLGVAAGSAAVVDDARQPSAPATVPSNGTDLTAAETPREDDHRLREVEPERVRQAWRGGTTADGSRSGRTRGVAIRDGALAPPQTTETARVNHLSRTEVQSPVVGQLSPYEEALRLQFVERNYAEALTAWDLYLVGSDRDVLRPDAEYHRAVCLVHLRRYDAARVELSRLAAAGTPAYRSRAATLLASLREVTAR